MPPFEPTVRIETLVIALNVLIALVGSGTLWKLFALASRAGRIEEKIEHLERQAMAVQEADDELNELTRNVAVIQTQIHSLAAQLSSLNALVMTRFGQG